MSLFPSTRTDYLDINDNVNRRSTTCTCAVRSRTRSTARRSSSRCCSATATPANSFLPPQVPFYDPEHAGPAVRPREAAKAELAKSEVPERLQPRVPRSSAPATQVDEPMAARSSSRPEAARHQRDHQDAGPEHRSSPSVQTLKYQLALQLLDDGHRRPGRARHVRGRPGRRRALVLHAATTTSDAIKLATKAQRDVRPGRSARRSTRRSRRSRRRTRSRASCTTRRTAARTPTRCTGFFV